MQEVQKITCVNSAGFIQKFRVKWNGGCSGWSDTYPNPLSATIDLNQYNLDFGNEVWVEVKAILGSTKESGSKVIYNPLSESTAVYRTTGVTLAYKIKLEGE